LHGKNIFFVNISNILLVLWHRIFIEALDEQLYCQIIWLVLAGPTWLFSCSHLGWP